MIVQKIADIDQGCRLNKIVTPSGDIYTVEKPDGTKWKLVDATINRKKR